MTAAEALEARLRSSRSRLDREVGVATAVAQRGVQEAEALDTARRHLELLEQAAGLLVRIGEERQESTQASIESLVTHGLRTIFGPELSFHVVPGVRNNAAVLDFVVRTRLENGEELDTPVLDARGGGVAAVVGFLLRLVVLLLAPHRQRMLLVLDETFAQLSEDYEGRLAEFLRELVDKTDVQVLMVTHSHAYSDVADKIYRFRLEAGRTLTSSDG